MAGKVLQVWHQDSPGVRVYVRRNWLTRLLCRYFNDEQYSLIGEKHLEPHEMLDVKMQAFMMACTFHETYERHAPLYGYTTREDTREFDPESPNGRLMVAVCMDWLTEAHRLKAA